MSRIVLGLDQGHPTGWGIAPERSPVLEHGLARTDAQWIEVVRRALTIAGGPENLWLMFEQHDHMPLTRLTSADRSTPRASGRHGAVERGPKQVHGMGKTYGTWIGMALMGAFAFHGKLISRSHLLEVRPGTWRSRVHGTTRGDVKGAALEWAARAGFVDVTDHNHAEGLGLTVYGSIDGLALFDAERAQARIEGRAKRANAKQGELFR